MAKLWTAVKCVIRDFEIIDPSWASANYIKYRNSARNSISEDIGKTRVKQMNEFNMR